MNNELCILESSTSTYVRRKGCGVPGEGMCGDGGCGGYREISEKIFGAFPGNDRVIR